MFYTIELNEINKIKDLSIKKIHDSEIQQKKIINILQYFTKTYSLKRFRESVLSTFIDFLNYYLEKQLLIKYYKIKCLVLLKISVRHLSNQRQNLVLMVYILLIKCLPQEHINAKDTSINHTETRANHQKIKKMSSIFVCLFSSSAIDK